MTNRINKAVEKAKLFPEHLRFEEGFKYTINHDVEKYPAAVLYGTWSIVYLKKLIGGKEWMDEQERIKTLSVLNKYRLSNGLFYPSELDSIKYSKSKEYMQLHCYNYAVGASMLLDNNFDFHSKYMDAFLDADFLERWLNQRSLERPWEESNNIVNVASYLALCNDHGQSTGKERLYQMLEWHNEKQNSKTGGFENFSLSQKNILQSMAGAVHNFHIHHYLNEPMKYEQKIGENVIPFLYQGPLTACLSIDFVELACSVLPFMENPYELQQALLFHLDALLNYQNQDGGWYENETKLKPTTANGMKEMSASSNSYATWFRMCSIGMISTTFLGDDVNKWSYRDTLGMGYYKPVSHSKLISDSIDSKLARKYWRKNLPYKLKNQAIRLAVKFF